MPNAQNSSSNSREFAEKIDFLQKAADLNPNLLFVIDLPAQKIIYVNKRVTELLGHDTAFVYSEGPEIFKKVVHPDDYQRRLDNLYKCRQQADEEECEVEVRFKIGQDWQWFKILEKVFERNESGTVTKTIGTAQNIHQQKLWEEQLREEHRRFEIAQTIGNIGSFERELPGDLMYCSAEFYHILGLEPKQERISLQEFITHVHPDDREAYREAISHTHMTGEPLDIVTRIIRTDGSIRHVHRRAMIRYEEGRPQRAYGIVQDITERVHAEEERNRQENLIRATEKIAKTGSYEADLQTNSFYFSDGLFRLFGEEPGAFEPSPEWIDKRSHPDDIPVVQQTIEQAAANRKGYKYTRRIYRKDGEMRILESHGSAVTDAAGNVIKFIGLVQDITERKRAEEDLHNSEQRTKNLLSVLQNAPDAYAVLSPGLHIEMASDAFLEVTFTKRQEILGRYVFDVFPDNPAIPDATGTKNLKDSLQYVLTSKKAHRMAIQHYDVRRPNGEFEEKYWSPINTPVINAQGEVESIIHRVLDVTELVKKQATVKGLTGKTEMLKTSLEEIQLQASQLKESRALLQSVFDASPNSIILYKAIYNKKGFVEDFEFLMLNAFTLQLLGVTYDIIGKRLNSEFPHAKDTRVLYEFKRTAETGMPADFEVLYEGDGLNHWFHFRATRLNDLLVVTTEDITERRKAARELLLLKEELAQRAIDRYNQLFNSIDEGFCTIKVIFNEKEEAVDLAFIDVNPAFEKHTGLENVLGRTIKEMIPNIETDILEFYGSVTLSGNPIRLEQHLPSFNRWFDIYAFPVDAPEKKHVAVLFTDITERKQAEKRQKYLLNLSDALKSVKDPIEIQDTAVQLLGEYLNADRTFFVELDGAANESIIARAWHKSGTTGKVLPYWLENWPKPWLTDGNTRVVQNAETDPAITIQEREVFLANDVGAAVEVPIIKQGQLMGALVANQQQPRQWGAVEPILVQETAERTWAALERSRTEAALREAHERTANILESTSDAFYAVDENFNFTYINKKTAQLWGRDQDALIGKHFWTEFPEAVGSESYHKHFEVLQKGRPVHYETMSPLINTWIEVSIYPGKRGSLSAFFRDIRERKEAEERQAYLLKLGDVLRSLADPAELQDAVTEEAMNFFDADRCYYCEIEEGNAVIRRDAFRGDLQTICGTYELGHFAIFQALIEAGSPFIVHNVHTTNVLNDELREMCIDMQLISFINIPVIKQDTTVGTFCLVQSKPRTWKKREIELAIETAERTWAGVERARAETALRQSQERLQKVLTIDTVGVLFFDMQSRFLDANEAFLQMIGHTRESFTRGKLKSGDVTLPEWMQRTRHAFKELGETGRFSPYEKELLRPDGTRWWGLFAGMRLSEEENVEFIIDITETKRVEQALMKAKEKAEAATRAKEDFVSTMSHEIRTPLNAVIGLTNLLLEQKPRKDQIDNLNSLSFSAKNLLSLINDILDFSKLEAGKMQLSRNEFNLPQLLSGLVQAHQPQAHTNGTELKLILDKDIPERIATDQLKLSQVLHNLVSNAVKFTREGRIEISVKLNDRKADELWLDFAIIDTGIGIAEDNIEHIFDKFAQAESSTVRHYGGTGLGLTITKLLLELMGSEINVESMAGEGSKFYFRLPAKVACTQLPPATSRESLENEVRDLSHIKVLLVEDVEINRKIIIQFLQNWWKLVPDEALNGAEAIQLAQRTKYDLILMDVRMPKMDGYEATRQIRKLPEYKDIPILALTADKKQEIQQAQQATQFSDLLTKPFEPQDLKQAILQHLSISGKGPSNTEPPAASTVENLNETEEAVGSPTSIPSFETSRYRKIAGNKEEVLQKLIGNALTAFEKYREEFSAAKDNPETLSNLAHKNTISIHYIQANKLANYIDEYRNLLQSASPEKAKLSKAKFSVMQEFEKIITGLSALQEKGSEN